MSKNKKSQKEEDVKIKLSSSFMTRARCRHCGSYPSYYYRFGSNRRKKDHRVVLNWFSYIAKYQGRLCEDFYLIEDPKDYTLISFFDYSLRYKSYDPTLHHKRGVKSKTDMNECLTCDCGKSYWVFNQQSVTHKKEILHRKSDKKFPKIFKY